MFKMDKWCYFEMIFFLGPLGFQPDTRQRTNKKQSEGGDKEDISSLKLSRKKNRLEKDRVQITRVNAMGNCWP